MKRVGESLLILFLIFPFISYGNVLTPIFPEKGVAERANNGYIDPTVDYSRFFGRVSDKDDTGRILKVKVENNNTKFLKAGDVVYFKVNNQKRSNFCKASVRAVEDFYFSIYVQDFSGCWNQERYFPRGMQLNFKTKKMADRVFEASKYRELLILRKEGFLKQLNEINHFLWTYDQQRLKEAADYDIQINELMRQKQLALDNMIQKKQENIMLQTELANKLNAIDESLDHYKVERREMITDRWHLDQDNGLPFGRRPLKIKR